jgi:hypothetical protein
MIARQQTTNLGQQPRLLRSCRDTCVHANAVSTPPLPVMHHAPNPHPPDTSLHAPFSQQSYRQSPISRANRQIQSP